VLDGYRAWMMPGMLQDDHLRVAATSASSTMLIGNVHDMPSLVPEGLQHAFRSSPASTTLCGTALEGLVILADLVFPYRGTTFINATVCRQCLAATADPAIPKAPGPIDE